MLLTQKLYAVERQAKQENLSPEQIKELRLAESLSVINELGQCIFAEVKNALPKCQIGKAMAYAYARWDGLSAYLYDGNLFTDNNLYLFAGSHEAAQRAAMIYSFFVLARNMK